MNKADLIRAVSRVLGTRSDSVRAIEATFESMRNSLRSGEKVVLSGFGSFRVKMRKARKGRNPKTGQEVPVPPRRAVRFKASKELLGQ
ncbi:MAG: HU family DNA-binding protein [Elusimicrobia bacterium]|nr:HU family DNA-binding protein [Elusimicrobiota bacterium]